MNKFRKIVIGAVVAAGIGCLAGAVGCDGSPDYYKLTFEGNGLDYIFQGALAPEDGDMFVSGDEVKSGVEVRFKLSLGADTIGTPTILLNGTEITPDDDGVYSFIIDRESSVTVSGLQQKEKITFSTDDYYKFYDEDGNLITGDVSVLKGEEYKFKLWVSPYIKDTYRVTHDTEELEPDGDGFYTITGGKSTVNVNNVEQDDSFLERGEGDGSEQNPFIIRKPIDLFMIAAMVNDDFNTSYSFFHYKLTEDIDMNGEKLFVIGDNSNTSAVFCGTFDGNGHTISNFYITDEVVNQSSFVTEYLQYVGLFGYSVASVNGPAVIKNLTLEDYEVTVHPASVAGSAGSYAGSVLGYGIGVQIDGVNCRNGKVVSYNDNRNMSYLGGIAGVLQSAYSKTLTDTITFDAYVNGCTVDAEVTGTGAIRSAGSVAGVLTTADTAAVAYVSNCVTAGTVYGAMYGGGIVGTLGRYSSVANCYTTAAVTAVNSIIGAGIDATFRRASAGGITGYAENDAVIYGCYAANASLSASSASNLGSTGVIAGYTDPALTEAADALESSVVNCYSKSDGGVSDLYAASLGWDGEEWDLSGSVPVYNGARTRTVTITVKNGDTVIGSYSKDISSPVPVYKWYEDDMPEFIDYSGNRSWGYYFDEELTKKVPCGYLPLSDRNLYVGLVDYSQAAGNYYIGASNYGNAAYFTLDEEGGVLFRDGGMKFESTYTYDGNKTILNNTCLGLLVYSVDQVGGFYPTVVVEKNADGYSITGSVYVASTDSDGNVSYSLGTIALTAQKQTEGFFYGEYVNGNGNSLLLRENGTGVLTVNNTSESFTFTINGDGVVVSTGIPVEVTDGKVTSFNRSAASLKDSYAGVWKTNANSSVVYEFDGFGTVKYGDVTGTYEETADGQAILTLGNKTSEAKFASDGALYIDRTAFYVSDGFTGSWYGRLGGSETVELLLGGVGADGYGEAEIVYYSGATKTFAGQYSVSSGGVLRVYVDEMLYGELQLGSSDGAASGGFLSYNDYRTLGYYNYVQAEFKIYDLFRGVWICDADGIGSVNFTGKGAEEGGATALVTGSNGKVTVGNYVLDSATTGVLTVGNKHYTMALDELNVKISLSEGQTASGSLAHRDGWYGVTLYDGETSYSFDGNGYLTGTVTVSGGTEINYTVGADGTVTLGGYTLTPSGSGSGFLWNGKTLSFRTGFANTWIMPVTNQEIIVSEVSADLTATVTVNGVTYNYIYSPTDNRLTCTVTDAKGAATVTKLSLLGGVELSVNVSGAQNGDYVCISKDKMDNWGGKFTSDEGDYWTFDGLGLSVYGSGTAIYTDAEGKTATYSYRQNEYGAVNILNGTNVGLLFAETDGDGYKKEGGQTAYLPVTPDVMYLYEVRYGDEYIVFDGAGGFLKHTDSGYEKYGAASYIPMSAAYAVVDIEGNGVKSLGSFEESGGTDVLKLTEYAEWTLSGTEEKYVFDLTGTLWRVDGNEYTRMYSYTQLSDKNRYGLEDGEGNTFFMTLNQTEKTFVLEEIENDED